MKKTKLFTSIAALALVLSLGACEVNVDVGDVDVGVDVNPSEGTSEDETTSESTPEDESTSESTSEGNTSENTSESGSTSESTSEPEPEPTTLSNYTLSIGIQYGGQLVEVPEYATAYIEGDWDSWTDWVALTPNSGRYEYTFETIDVDTYQYQLVLAYNDEQPGWTYRITQDGVNASFTVNASDGDSYTNEVTVTASKALTEIIPDPSAAISNVTLTIDITYNGTSQGVLDYGTLWIQGGWDSWASWVACTAVDDKYVATFDSLSPIEYEFLGVIYYKDEELPDSTAVWDYKVNGSANAKFTVSSNAVSTTLVATKALAEILPEKGGDEGEEIEEGIVFGFELNGVLNAIDGKTQSEGTYRGSYTANLEDAVRVTYEEGETIGEYYLSFTLDGTTYWISIIEGDHTNLSYATEKTPIYYNPTYECWGNATQTYFLCQNATYQCLYASAISSWINSSPIAGLYNTDGTKVTGFVGEVYEEPITDIPYFEVEEPEDGGQYYLGYQNNGSWYMYNGKGTNNGYYLSCTVLGDSDPTSAVLVKTTKNDDGTWGLTSTLNEVESTIYAYPSGNYGEITTIETANLSSAKTGAVFAFSWDNTYTCFNVTLTNGTFSFSTYANNTAISLSLTPNTYARSLLYTANPEYEVPQHEDSGIEYSSPTSFTADAIIAEYPEYTLGSGSGSQAASVQLEGKTTTLGEVSIAWGEGGTSGVRLWSASPNQIRVYKGTTDTIISVSEGYKLESISLTVNSSGNGLSGFTVTGGTISVSSTSATISVTGDTVGLTLPSDGTNTYFTEILVYYTAV